MKTLVLNEAFYASAKKNYASELKKAYECPKMVRRFLEFIAKRDFLNMKKFLDKGFDPNLVCVPVERSYSYDNGMITGTETLYYRILDVWGDNPAIAKLLRMYGGKTSDEISEEYEREWKRKMQQEEAEREARVKSVHQKEMEELDKILS